MEGGGPGHRDAVRAAEDDAGGAGGAVRREAELLGARREGGLHPGRNPGDEGRGCHREDHQERRTHLYTVHVLVRVQWFPSITH